MQKKKKNLIEKIVKKDYNNELEEVLEQKKFDEYAKSTLLGILYKVETAYKDLETVKKDVKTKDEYLSSFIEIIKKNCSSIKIVQMSDKENQIPNKKTYVIDKKTKKIIAYPIERKILYAIAKISNKDKIVKDDYFLIDETLSDLINVGNNINMVEPLRDFNGYSWTTIPQEIESIDHNLIYQDLRMLVGHQFLDKWVKDSEFMIDYFYAFKDRLETLYGTENKDKLVNLLISISILLSIKFDKTKYEPYMKIKNDVEERLANIENKGKFIEDITLEKREVIKEIRELDQKINDRDLLQKEYVERNKELPPDGKIFSIKILTRMLKNEKDEKNKKLEKLNKIMRPKEFIKYQKEVEERQKHLAVLDNPNTEETLENLKLEFQKVFLDCIKINIQKAETKQDIIKLFYDVRYFSLLQYDYERKIKDIKELELPIENIARPLIKKAIELKAIEKVSESEEANYQVLKNLLKVRIIKLEDAHLKITKEKGKTFLKIYDENEFEEKVKIQKPKNKKA